MNKAQKLIVGVVVVAVIALGLAFLLSGGSFLGRTATGPQHLQLEWFKEGILAGRNSQFEISPTGTVRVGASGTPLSNYQCATATWNPGVMSSSTVASTSLLLDGSVLANPVLASFENVSSSVEWMAEGKVSANGSTTIVLRPLFGTQAYLAGLNLGTSTARTCIVQ